MDRLEAAQRLGIAAYTIESIEYSQELGGWLVTEHHMADHWARPHLIPGAGPGPEETYFVGEQGPEMIDVEVTVPDGTVAETMAWVGEDVERAQAALDVELAKDKPRSTLVAQLEGLLGQ